MSWKKSVFSNLMWGAYTLVTGLAVMELSVAAVLLFGVPSYLGVALALVLALIVAGCAFLFHRYLAGDENVAQGGLGRVLGEAVFVVVFLALGFALRMTGITGINDGGGYYEAAVVAEGQNITQLVHGAVYLYLQLLHVVFVFLGNKLVVGIWLQVILQLSAVLILYLSVRKLAGVLPAMTMLCFFMCAEPMVQGALVLSPEPLYLLLFAIGLDLVAACSGNQATWCLFLPAGVWIGLMGYMDISGFLLVFIVLAVIAANCEEEISAKIRTADFGICMAGVLAGFLGAILADAVISAKSFLGVLNAWWAIYRPSNYRFTMGVLYDGLLWEGPLLFLLCFGIFSYWFSRERERMSLWAFMVCVLAVAEYFGLLTDELPSNMYLLFCMTVLAGVGIRACFKEKAEAVGRSKEADGPDSTETKGVIEKPESMEEVAVEETGYPVKKQKQSAVLEEDTIQFQEKEPGESAEKAPSKPQYIDNPLPLPKPHQKRVLDYKVNTVSDEDDFDVNVDENDDFDIS